MNLTCWMIISFHEYVMDCWQPVAFVVWFISLTGNEIEINRNKSIHFVSWMIERKKKRKENANVARMYLNAKAWRYFRCTGFRYLATKKDDVTLATVTLCSKLSDRNCNTIKIVHKQWQMFFSLHTLLHVLSHVHWICIKCICVRSRNSRNALALDCMHRHRRHSHRNDKTFNFLCSSSTLCSFFFMWSCVPLSSFSVPSSYAFQFDSMILYLCSAPHRLNYMYSWECYSNCLNIPLCLCCCCCCCRRRA